VSIKRRRGSHHVLQVGRTLESTMTKAECTLESGYVLYPGMAYSRVRLTRVWRTLEYATTKEECTIESKSCLESVGAPTPASDHSHGVRLKVTRWKSSVQMTSIRFSPPLRARSSPKHFSTLRREVYRLGLSIFLSVCLSLFVSWRPYTHLCLLIYMFILLSLLLSTFIRSFLFC